MLSVNSVSVIITVYNNKLYLEQAIASIKNQDISFELIVIDDCSNDGSYELLMNLKKLYDFKLIQTTKNSGPSVARNLGIAHAKSKYIAFLDGDDYWLENRLNIMLDLVKKDTSLDVVFSDALIEQDGSLTNTRQSSLMPVPEDDSMMLTHLFKRNCINMCAVLIKASLAKKIKFNEHLRSAEDYDFWIRIASSGATFKFIDSPLVVYRRYSTSLSSRRLHSINATLSMLSSNEELAKTPIAKLNLNLQRMSLYEELLANSTKKSDVIFAITHLSKLRRLGKREHVLKCFLFTPEWLIISIKERLIS